MVWSSQTSGDEDIIQLAADSDHTLLMGCGFFRILCPSAGKQNRIHRKRRSFQPHAVEDHTGGDFADGIHHSGNRNVQGTAFAMEPSGCILLPDNGCILRIFEINSAFLCKKPQKNLEVKKKCVPLQSQNDKTVGSYNG